MSLFSSTATHDTPHCNIDVTAIDHDEMRNAAAMLGARFANLAEGYLEDTAQYLERIHDALIHRDYDSIAAQAHPLKSSSAMLGLTAISIIAKQIEAAAKAQEPVDHISAMIPPINAALAHATTALRSV